MRGSAVYDLFDRRRHPDCASCCRRDDVEVIEAPEEVALPCIALDSQCGELLSADGPRLEQERVEDLIQKTVIVSWYPEVAVFLPPTASLYRRTHCRIWSIASTCPRR